ncbi:BRCT domain-containing protein At4g02110-like [Impatiens glandulifera]|uniref:BRCT domain-containing protein At4g02110-like n=1 Tax=Impatiens glandulifera TaxID=253017 RepID=UPI001FB143D5|nr:BRCT domain-containing protein At4g02110-like [Impatiens glandulifera]
MYRPLRDLNGIPGTKPLTVCLTGYQRQDRDDIMTMVALMGAKFSKPLIANKVTHLVCYKFEGEKYELAKKITWIKIVNHRWLEDCLTAWEILPESSYAKSGYELEMEAEAKDSDEENVTNDDINNKEMYAGTLRTNPSPLSRQGVSRINSPTIGRNSISKILATSEGPSHKTSPAQHIRNKEPDILCPRDATFNGNVNLAASNNFADDLVYTDGSAPKSNSGSSKFSSISYSRKNRKNDRDDTSGISYVKENELCGEDKQSGIFPGKRTLDLPSNSSKLQKTNQNLKSPILEPLLQSGIGDLSPEDNYDRSLVTNGSFSSARTPQSSNLNMELPKGGKFKEIPNMELPKGGNNTNSLSKPRRKAIAKNKPGSKSKFTPKSTENEKGLPLDSSPGTLQLSSAVDEEEMVKKCSDIVETKLTAVETNVAGIHGNEAGKASWDDTIAFEVLQVASDNEELKNKLGATKSAEVGNLKENLNMELPKSGNNTNSLSKPRRKVLAAKRSGSKSKCTPERTENRKGPLQSNPGTLQLSNTVVEEEKLKKCFDIVETESTSAVETNVAGKSALLKALQDASDNEELENKLGATKSLTVGKLKDNSNMELPKGGNNTNSLSKPRRKVLANKKSDSKPKLSPERTETHKGPLHSSSSVVEEETVMKCFDIVETKLTTKKASDEETDMVAKSDKDIEDKSLPENELRISKVKSSKAKKRPLGKISKDNDENATSVKVKGPKASKKKKSVPAKELKNNMAEVEDKENMPGHKNVRTMQVGEVTPKITNVKGVERTKVLDPKCFILSGHKHERKEFQQIIKRLKGKVCRDSHQWSYQATHFIVPDQLKRTEKFFAAAASGRWILKSDYLTASNEAGMFLEEEAYEWHKKGVLSENGAISLEAPRKWRLLREQTGHGAFNEMRIIVYGECIVPPLETLKHVIKAGDGTILATSPPYTRFLKSSGVDFAVVSPGMPRVDFWVQEFLRHEIPCISADYLVEYVCKPGYSLDKYVEYNTQVWAEKSLQKLISISEE